MTRFLAITFCKLSYGLSRRLDFRARGIGMALRAIRSDFAFSAVSRLFWFDRRVAAAYCILPTGASNEPETAAFLIRLTSLLDVSCSFIDVGASIGEFAILAAGLPRIDAVLAFEPQEACCDAIRSSARLNRFSNVEVRQAAVSDQAGHLSFSSSTRSPTAAQKEPVSPEAISVSSVTLDEELGSNTAPSIILIDVEGAELKVVQGGREWIRRSRPLIIFEFNQTTRRYFTLAEMTSELGPMYSFWRLRSDGTGLLDRTLDDTWNIVAVPGEGPFTVPCHSLIANS